MKRIIIALPLALFGAFWFWYLTLPWPITLRSGFPDRTAFMEMRLDEAQAEGETLEIVYEPVALESIARPLRRAVVIAEDGRFREHGGVDWQAIAEEVRYQGDDDFSVFDPSDLRAVVGAINYYRANRDEVRGRSTITQQLAKNLYFTSDRSVLRKIEELVVAKRLEQFLSKDRILELYLNTAEWGPGIFGAEAAAQHYFDRSADRLNLDQAAALAATLPHPLTSNPKTRPGRMAWRKDMIRRRLGGGQGSDTATETVPLEPPKPVDVEAPVLGEPVDTAPAPVRMDTLAPPAMDTLPADTTMARQMG